MQCPVCKTSVLKHQELESGLKSMFCPGCKGTWIASYQYWLWRDKHGKSLPEIPLAKENDADIHDNITAKLCPECGHFLIRYPVGHGCAFQLDRCGHCGGMWFDCQEWEALKRRNLHDDVHLIFSEVWQHRVRNEERHRDREKFLEQKFGQKDYARIKEIKAWLQNHPQSGELYAFLNDREN
ncbi:MAG: zf-TFIIB domain-containing protein [Sedimentisphaerales bacterium]|nr:zf-TFIIB domain-containing protein [Sedimentisphaerales bacterium]